MFHGPYFYYWILLFYYEFYIKYTYYCSFLSINFFLPKIYVEYNFDSECNGLVLAMLPILIYKLINCGQITQSA